MKITFPVARGAADQAVFVIIILIESLVTIPYPMKQFIVQARVRSDEAVKWPDAGTAGNEQEFPALNVFISYSEVPHRVFKVQRLTGS